jgi:hypothetical protein
MGRTAIGRLVTFDDGDGRPLIETYGVVGRGHHASSQSVSGR